MRYGSLLCVPVALITSFAQQPLIETGTETGSEGATELRVTNRNSVPISAFAIVVTWTRQNGEPAAEHLQFVDNLLRERDRLLMPKDTRTFTFGNRTQEPYWRCEAAVKGVVFEDGTAFGDPEWTERIITRRQTSYETMKSVVAQLNSARGVGASRDELINDLKNMEKRDLDALNARLTPKEERIAVTLAYRRAYTNLAEIKVDGETPPVNDAIRYVTRQIRNSITRLEADSTVTAKDGN